MGYDTVNVLAKEIKEKDVKEFLEILGYYGKGNVYGFYKDEDYKYFEGVTLFIGREDNDLLHIETHTSIWSSDYDVDFQNYTVKQLKKRFGGSFCTDNGQGRYLKVNNPKRSGAENGCYFAFFELHNQFSNMKRLISKIENTEMDKVISGYSKESDHVSLAANMLTTYIASIIETYFRNIYVALLKYSDRKEKIFQNSKIFQGDILEIGCGNMTLEQAIGYSKSFQNINKINSSFKELDSKIDLHSILSKPYRRRKENLFQTIHRVLEHRHGVVHRMEFDKNYDEKMILKDIESIENSLKIVYNYICESYNWQSYE